MFTEPVQRKEQKHVYCVLKIDQVKRQMFTEAIRDAVTKTCLLCIRDRSSQTTNCVYCQNKFHSQKKIGNRV